MMPKSTGTRSPLASMKMLPGCMSAWKKPSRNTCLKKLSAARARIWSGSKPAAISAARSSEAIPLTRSSVSTRRAVRCQSTRGTRKPWSPAKFSASSEAAAASRRRSISSRVQSAKVSTTLIGLRRRKPGWRRSTQVAIQAKKSMSRTIWRSMPGRSTLIATSSPAAVTPKCTWAIEAAATGRSSKLVNSSGNGRPSSRSISWRASALSNAGRSSCSCERSAASSWPSRSARVARLWPSLMKLGPSSCSAAARRWPGRPGASWRDSRRARRRTTSGSGRSSSGKSALWRARQRPMPSRRQRWRLERSIR